MVGVPFRLRGWITNDRGLTPGKCPGIVVTPPLGVRDVWFYYFELVPPESLPPPPPPPTPLVYLRLEPAGYWSAQRELLEPFLAVEADHCGLCGRSQLACAEVYALRGAWSAGALRFPRLFCTHHSEAPPLLTRRQAPKSIGSFLGLPLEGTIPTSSLKWARSCTPSEHAPALTAPPWVLGLPSPWLAHLAP